MGKHKYIEEKNKFIKKYNIVDANCITMPMAKKARKEIGFSTTTVRVDIQCSISSFMKSKYFNCI